MTRPLDILRLLMGAILVATAIRWAFPALLPFVPEHQWTDPMAVRLMAAFQHSGLSAVARFIHFAAGLMLLTNRYTPFALAAVLPVNLCGLYISVVVEGTPGVAILAVLLVALNALLMFAHLPYYAGVLAKDYLADGETTEAGGTYESLFVNPMSGAPQAAYLGGGVVLLAALAFYWRVVPGLNSGTGLVVLTIPTLLFAIGLLRALTKKPSQG